MPTRKKLLFMKRFLYTFLCSCVLLACTGPSIKDQLDTCEQDMERNPKDTYKVLLGVQDAERHLSDEDEARLAILTIKAKDLAYESLVGTDSLELKKAIDYYTKNDDWRMLMWGYYLLGGVYRDVGDAPKGVGAYMKVVELADTTKSDCNYRVMARAMAQMSELQELQKVQSKAIESIKQAEDYSLKGRDTTYYYDCAFGLVGLQALYGNYEPLIHRSFQLIQDCLEYGDTAQSIKQCVGFAWFFLQIDMVAEADSMLNLYNRYDGRPYPIFFGTKGKAHLAHGRLDSAESYFRRELEADDWNNRQTAYRGLKEVFERRHQLDSALKYATLQCDAVDSDYKHKVSEDIVQMEQVFNYEAEKERANRMEVERAQLHRLIALLLLVMALIGAVVAVFWQRRVARMRETQMAHEKHVEQMKAEAANAEARLARMESSLMQNQVELEKHRNSLLHIQQELEVERERKVEALEERQKSWHRIRALETELQRREQMMAELQEDIQRKETEMEQVRGEMEQMNNLLEEFREDARQMVNLTEGVKAMKACLKAGRLATSEAWEELQKEIHRLYPSFIKDLHKQVSSINSTELRVSMLLKMGFTFSEIATLTGLSPSTMTKSRRHLYKKAFSKEPKDLEEVDQWLAEMEKGQ